MNGRNTGTSRTVGCSARPSAQSNSSVNGGAKPVPDLLDRLDLEAERVGERLLRQPRVDPDPKLAERQLQQREAARRIEVVEHRRQARRGASSFEADRSRSTASLMRMVASSISGGSSSRFGQSSATVSAVSPT